MIKNKKNQCRETNTAIARLKCGRTNPNFQGGPKTEGTLWITHIIKTPKSICVMLLFVN